MTDRTNYINISGADVNTNEIATIKIESGSTTFVFEPMIGAYEGKQISSDTSLARPGLRWAHQVVGDDRFVYHFSGINNQALDCAIERAIGHTIRVYWTTQLPTGKVELPPGNKRELWIRKVKIVR